MSCFFILRSKLPDTPFEFLISQITNGYVHSECILLGIKPELAQFVFTIYAHGKVECKKIEYIDIMNTEDLWDNLILPLSRDEGESMFKILMDFHAHGIEYNYSDSRLLLPLFNCFDDNPFIEDVPVGMDVGKIKKVFCSQMITIALRESLENENEGMNSDLKGKILKVNSRLISPGNLRAIVAEYSKGLSAQELWERIQYFKETGNVL